MPENEVTQTPVVRRTVKAPEQQSSGMQYELDEKQQSLINFVESKISEMENKLLFNGFAPSFPQLNKALSSYSGTLYGLTTLYEMERWNCTVAQEVYDEWWAEHIIKERDRVNPKDAPASKWYSSKEIEYIVMSTYKDERAKLIANIREAEARKSTVERLINGWEAYRWCLITLSKNACAEANASGGADYDETN